MPYVFILVQRLGFLLALYTILRLAFYGVHQALFPAVTYTQLAQIGFYGLRFDIAAVLYINVIVAILHLVPVKARASRAWVNVTKIFFYFFNIVAFIFIVADFAYFPFILKRSDSGVFSYSFDIWQLLPQFMADYWYLLLLGLALLFFVELFYRKTQSNLLKATSNIVNTKPLRARAATFTVEWLVFLLGLSLTVIGMRGGLQLRPITPITATKYVAPALTPLIINTPFNIIHTLQRKHLNVPQYAPQDTVDAHFSVYKNLEVVPKQTLKRTDNVVIIIMESLSKSYTNLDGNNSYTPFLDSLMQHSLVFTKAFANGKHSNQGIAAILSSIPVLMHEPYPVSIYQANNLAGLGSVLSPKGYHTSFFHGANNGSFNIDVFSNAAGFVHYYGRNEYNNDADFDGNWGIFDEPYFKYAAQTINDFPEPFITGIFTLTAHYPFALPQGYNNKFKKGSVPMHELCGYADYALSQFFAEAATMPWYNNTLFIITADHTGAITNEYEAARLGAYSIPMLWYKPDNSLAAQSYNDIVQQIDIMPSVLDYLGFQEAYTAFGNSVFNKDTTTNRYAYSYLSGVYQIIDDNYLLQFDGTQSMAMYAYKTDSLLQRNVLKQYPNKQRVLEKQLKMIIQQHHYRIRNNLLIPPTKNTVN
jgi:phosphoglycerol transferase MdoB-like AlkP superfamily enzyme